MSPSWNLAELKAHIRRTSCDDALLDIVDSVDRSTLIFCYHLSTARDAMKGIVDESEPAGIKNTSLILGASDKQDEYAYAKLVNEANVIGCVYAARSIFDIFSHLVNGLVLGSSIPLHKCDVAKVHEALPASELKDQLDHLLTSHWFNYVVGYINTTKHRRLISHQFSVSFEHGVAGIRLGAFEYNGRTFPAYWGDEMLQGVLDVKNTIVACGRTLNHMCGAANA